MTRGHSYSSYLGCKRNTTILKFSCFDVMVKQALHLSAPFSLYCSSLCGNANHSLTCSDFSHSRQFYSVYHCKENLPLAKVPELMLTLDHQLTTEYCMMLLALCAKTCNSNKHYTRIGNHFMSAMSMA